MADIKQISVSNVTYDVKDQTARDMANQKAPLVSPALTGVPTAPTPVKGTNTTQIATTAFVQEMVAAIDKDDIGLSNVDNVKQYSVTNPPPYPVTSVNGQTGDVTIAVGGSVDSVNGKTGIVVLSASDVGALPDTTVVPSKTSDLTNDSGFITSIPIASKIQLGGVKIGAGLTVSTEGTISVTGGGTADAVEWDNVLDKPITISGYGITDAKIDNGTITLGAQSITPLTDAALTPYAKAADIPTKTSQLTNDSSFATTSQVNAKYTKPSTGIPETDLSAGVQDSLAKADSALQSAPVTSVAGKTGAVSLTKSDVGLGNVDNVSINARLNRTTNVNAADTNYTTYMARGEALFSAETTPTVNGTIAWQYE